MQSPARTRRTEALRVGQVPYIVLSIALMVSVATALLFRAAANARDESRLQNAVQSTEDRVQRRLDAYVAVLLATRGMFAARDGVVDAAHFHAFVAELDLQHRYPGIQGVGYTRAFSAAERPAIEAEMRAAGVEDFHVWPAESPREELHAIVMLEPLDRRNRAAIGYDMYSEPVRRDAMTRARDTGEPAASGPVTLVQEIDEHKQAGFLLYVPVYRGGRVPATLEERRRSLMGFVYSPFRMDDLLHGIFGSETQPRLGFALTDRDVPATLLHESSPTRRDARLSTSSHLQVAGRTWLVELWSLPAFERASSGWAWPYVFAIGLAVSALLYALSLRQTRGIDQLRIHQRVLESMREGVSVSDENGIILYTNPAEDQMFGYEPGELLGKPVTVQNTYAPGENERIVREVIAELRSKQLWVGEFENVKKDGTPFVTTAHITAITVGGVSHWVCVQQDVTDRKRADRERAELLERETSLRATAEAASRTKDEFLAMLGHELRNPLAPIVMALALLEQRGALAGARELAIITRQVAHLRRLVDDLLDVSAITRGKVQLRKTRIDVLSAVHAAIEVVRPLLDERRHQLDVDETSGLVVEADEARLIQVIGNLLNNAAKYTDPGGKLHVLVEREGAEVVVRVRDDGHGIPKGEIERLFEPFEQGERAADRALGGLGIGLAVVRGLVHLHGGTVEGRSGGPGEGSEFVVRLPAMSSEAPKASIEASVVPTAVRARRVLVVDDNVDAAEMLGELLGSDGHEVTVAHDGERALALASDRTYDVAILDIGLPGMDGYELARRLRSTHRGTLVALTGYGQARDRKLAHDAGFDHHLVKPVDSARVLALVASARVVDSARS